MGRTILFTAVGLLASTVYALPSNTKREDKPTTVYDFKDITPSREINWVSCFESFECTYLTVPLDYENPDVGDTNVAFIRLKSPNPDAQDILFNPGGPGASGVKSLIDFAPAMFVPAFGSDYNYVSFDPRGVNNTEPKLTCSPTPEQRDLYIATRLKASAPLPEQWAQSLALGEFCTTLNSNTTAKYAGTSAVVQDLIHFTNLTAIAKGQAPENTMINYFGISYGTLLGQTLAQMYPQRLGRIVLDANVYGVGHYQGFEAAALDDTDHAFGFFFSFCYQAGEELCPLAANATSAGDVETRYRALLTSLDATPVVKQPGSTPGFVTRADLESFAFSQMYSPSSGQGFKILAAAAAGLESGNSTIFDALNKPQLDNAGTESLILITTIDVAGRYVLKNYTDFEVAVAQLQEESFYGWKYYAIGNALIANGMGITPPPSQLFGAFERKNTSNPILFVTKTGDPITPLSAAFKMSQYFEGSRVLTLDAPGHSFLGTSSNCTVGYVKAYFDEGTLPEVGTVCKSDVTPEMYFKTPTV